MSPALLFTIPPMNRKLSIRTSNSAKWVKDIVERPKIVLQSKANRHTKAHIVSYPPLSNPAFQTPKYSLQSI